MKNLIPIILFLFYNYSYSLSINEVKIVGEEIENCSLSRESVNASLSSVARYNRINIKATGDVTIYHQVNALPVQSNFCVVNLHLDFRVHDYVRVKDKNIFTTIQLCSQSYMLTGIISGIQTRLNDVAKQAFELCLVEIEKK